MAVGLTQTGVYSGREGDGEAPGGAAAGQEGGGWSRQRESDSQTDDLGDQHACLVTTYQR